MTETKTVIKQKKVFPDISTIADIPVTHPSSGKIEIKEGVTIDWNNL